MEPRPIDANATYQSMVKTIAAMMSTRRWMRRDESNEDEILSVIQNAPTLDYAPVRHGEWVGLEFDGYADGCPVYDLWECSECKGEHKGEYDTLTDYCPNCGAKMKEDSNIESHKSNL